MLKQTLSQDVLNRLGRQTGQSKRLRKVTPFRLLLCMLSGLGSGSVESIADLLRTFNYQNQTTVAYKAFYNRLDRPGFPAFMEAVFARLVEKLALKTLEPAQDSPLWDFEDIVLQDGSSFAVKDSLKAAFPGRFNKIKPAAVEIHATYSGLSDQVIRATLTPDTFSERAQLPSLDWLQGKLLLADRGYPSLKLFDQLNQHWVWFIMRLSGSFKPWVKAVWLDGVRHVLPRPVKLKTFLSQNQGHRFDLDVQFASRKGTLHRLIIVAGKKKPVVLCTNLPRARYGLDFVEKLYRFRWQVELSFKEWKSYANLHQFDTGNEHIAAGLIWASLCAALLKRFTAHATQLSRGVPVSTRRVAMCAHHFLSDLCRCALAGFVHLEHLLGEIFDYLAANAQRSNPQRERRRGRLRVGLEPRLSLK
jgi:hypothetical protein